MSTPLIARSTSVNAIRLIGVAEVLGLIETTIDHDIQQQLDAALAAFAGLGVAKTATRTGTTAERAATAFEAIEGSPMPEQEWGPISRLLGDDVLARLTGISQSSLHRYRGAERATPLVVAVRLHFLTMVVADLIGSYNDYGIRRWFERPRSQLDGASPAGLLTDGWSPEDTDAERVRALASALLAGPGT